MRPQEKVGVARRTRGAGDCGISLLEVVIATAAVSVLMIAFFTALRTSSTNMVKSRELIRRSRVVKSAHAQVKAMNFFDLMACDSALPQYGFISISSGGLHSAAYAGDSATSFSSYPSSPSLSAIQEIVVKNGFHHFDLSVEPMRRDRSASAVAGLTTNLVPFTDIDRTIVPAPPAKLAPYTTGDGYDDYDAAIAYQDLNSDGDYYDSWYLFYIFPAPSPMPAGGFVVPPAFMGVGSDCYALVSSTQIPGGSTFLPANPTRIAEMPDTRLKRVTFRLWDKKNRLTTTEVWLVAQMDITGQSTDDMESPIILDVTSPLPGAFLYAKNTAPLISAQDLVITKGFSAADQALRADNVQPLVLTGNTAPLGALHFTTAPFWTPGFSFPDSDSGAADVNGAFALPVPNMTSLLVEGSNSLGGISIKFGGVYSPFWKISAIYDLRPPLFDADKRPADNATVFTRTPFIGVQLYDDTVSTTSVAGIARETVWVGTGPAAGTYDQASSSYMENWAVYSDSWVVVASTVSGLVDPLPNATWVYVKAEGADRARYKANTTWRFFVNSNAGDVTEPEIDNIAINPGPPTVISCRLRDDESGLDWRTIDFRVEDAVSNVVARVNPTATPRMADYFNPVTVINGGILTYRFPVPLTPGSYTAHIQAENFAGISKSTSPVFVVP